VTELSLSDRGASNVGHDLAGKPAAVAARIQAENGKADG
jgi:hypothetical protein